MNPSSNEVAGMQLPPPVEQLPATGNMAEAGNKSVESVPLSAAESGITAGTSSMPIPGTIPLPTPTPIPPTSQKNDDSITTNMSGAQTADDGDLIEKEWVDKAKAIVARNREDPYRQSEELTVFKAEYMQKRYNKTIKLNK